MLPPGRYLARGSIRQGGKPQGHMLRPFRVVAAATATGTAPAAVDWVSGACMVLRREALGKSGAFDERFFMYFEDADLCRRVRETGWRVYYLPEVEVVHQTGGSSRSKPKAVWMLHKSAFIYHRKHGAHGPLGLYSGAVLLGLAARALVKLASGCAAEISAKRSSHA